MIATKPKSLSQVIKEVVPHLVMDAARPVKPDDVLEFACGALQDETSAGDQLLTSVHLGRLQKLGITLIGVWTANGMARVHFARNRSGVPAVTGSAPGGRA